MTSRASFSLLPRLSGRSSPGTSASPGDWLILHQLRRGRYTAQNIICGYCRPVPLLSFFLNYSLLPFSRVAPPLDPASSSPTAWGLSQILHQRNTSSRTCSNRAVMHRKKTNGSDSWLLRKEEDDRYLALLDILSGVVFSRCRQCDTQQSINLNPS